MAFEAADTFNRSQLAQGACGLCRVISFETNAQGRRRFVACTAERLWKRMVALPVGARHFYEIIREGCACHLYLDIEFRRSTNRGLDGSALVAFLTVRILAAVHERFGIRTGLEDVIDLDSSTDAKFSRHLVVVLPGGQRFRDNQHVGRFVLLLVAALANEAQTDSLAASLWVNPESAEVSQRPQQGAAASAAAPPPDLDVSPDPAPPGGAGAALASLEGRTPIVDLGVYTRNRAMRLYMSRKYGKRASLMPASSNAFAALGVGTDAGSFRAQSGAAGPGEHASPGAGVLAMYNALLRGDAPQEGWAGRGDRITSTRHHPGTGSESPFPPLDAWVLQLASSFGGPPARIRAVAVQTRAVRFISLDRAAVTSGDARIAASAGSAPQVGTEAAAGTGGAETVADASDKALVRRLVYSMAENRFCLRIKRQHRSNNVAFSIDLESGIVTQSCMDPLCRGWRSDPEPVPVEVLPDQVPVGVRVEPLE